MREIHRSRWIPAQRPVTRSFDVFFDLRLNKRLSKQAWGWWFETPTYSLWRQCNVMANVSITNAWVNPSWPMWRHTCGSILFQEIACCLMAPSHCLTQCWLIVGFLWHTREGNIWWRHQMETFAALLALCVGNSPNTGEFPSQKLVMQSFGVVFDLRLNKCLSKQSWRRWFETQSRSLWRHRNIHSECLCYYFVFWVNATSL